MDIIISRYIIFLNLLQNLVLREHIQHFSKPKPKIEYNWWQRLWRIHQFLQRSRKKKKQAQKDKRNKRKQEKKFNRRKKWRKYKVVIKSIFKRKKKTSKELATIKKRSFLAKWKRRRRRRIIRVFIKSIGKTKKMTKARIEYIQRYEKEKAFNKYRKKRRRQFIIKRNLLILKNLLTGKGLPPKRYKKAPSPWRQIWLPEQLTITANSLMFFLLSYFFIAFFDKLATGLTS
ncbi:MAG: hypothetical protein KAH25_10290, partial [Bacteroidales bacterium]|nr:hypothetical protein [Bacteroidales bacterium]